MNNTEEKKETDNKIWIYDSSNYEYPAFDERYKPHWFECCSSYDEQGHFNGDPLDSAKVALLQYMRTWCDVHNMTPESLEAKTEEETVREVFYEKYRTKDITPEEAQKLWDDFTGSDAYYEEQGFYARRDWEEELDLLREQNHILRGNWYIISGCCQRWNGTSSGSSVEYNSRAADIADLIEWAVDTYLDGHDNINVYADPEDGAIVMGGTHHDGGTDVRIYAIDDTNLKDADGHEVEPEEWLDLNKMDPDDAIGKITVPLASIVANVYDSSKPMHPFFATKNNK